MGNMLASATAAAAAAAARQLRTVVSGPLLCFLEITDQAGQPLREVFVAERLAQDILCAFQPLKASLKTNFLALHLSLGVTRSET